MTDKHGHEITVGELCRFYSAKRKEWLPGSVRASEIAAIVAWLRAPCDSSGHEDRFCAWCNVRQNLASEIERGEHHKKKRRRKP